MNKPQQKARSKIVDSGPISSSRDDQQANIKPLNSTDSTMARSSTAKKRPMSPFASTSVTPSQKKVKVEPSTNETTKKPLKVTSKQDTAKKPAAPAKKMPVPLTSLPTKDPKRLKTSESVSTKLIKSQSTASISVEKKSKDVPPAPLKVKVSLQPSTTAKPVPVKKVPKVPVKTPPTSAPIVKSPVSIRIPHDPSAIKTQKKIPKKPPPPVPAPVIEKATRPSMPPAERKPLSSPAKPPSNAQRHGSSTTKKAVPSITISRLDASPSDSKGSSRYRCLEPPERSQSVRPTTSSSRVDRKSDHPVSTSLKISLSARLPAKCSPSSSPLKHSRLDPPSHGSPSSSSAILSQSPLNTTTTGSSIVGSNTSSPSMDLLHHETLTDFDLGQLSDSEDEPATVSNRLSSLESDSAADEDDEDDLPTGLTNDDLRYKLIYIYNRFQSNSREDLSIFVRFFQRHQLINPASLSPGKANDSMFTYDLFSLSSSHIGELASDLGYSTPSGAAARESLQQ